MNMKHMFILAAASVLMAVAFNNAFAAPQPAEDIAILYIAEPHNTVTADCFEGANAYTHNQVPLVIDPPTPQGQTSGIPIGNMLINGPGIYECSLILWNLGGHSDPPAPVAPQTVTADMMVDIPNQPSLPAVPTVIGVWRVEQKSDGTWSAIPYPQVAP